MNAAAREIQSGEWFMKHVKKISVAKADAFTNYYNAIWRAWQDFQFAKKNEYSF